MDIKDHLRQAGYDFCAQQIEQFEQYKRALYHWNRQFNLTSIEAKQFETHHLLDSLVLIDYLRSGAVLDVGTGAGLPGVPLAIACADIQFTLLDARNKKIQFLQRVKSECQLANITAVHERIEQHQPASLYGQIVCRAFASLPQIFKWTNRLLADDGCILAMKGQLPAQELAELEHMAVHYEVKSISVPGLNAERHLILMDKQ